MALYTHPACGASPSSARPGSRTFAPQHSSVRNVQRGTLSQSIQHATGRRAWCAKSALPAHLPETVAGGQRGSVRPTLYHTRNAALCLEFLYDAPDDIQRDVQRLISTSLTPGYVVYGVWHYIQRHIEGVHPAVAAAPCSGDCVLWGSWGVYRERAMEGALHTWCRMADPDRALWASYQDAFTGVMEPFHSQAHQALLAEMYSKGRGTLIDCDAGGAWSDDYDMATDDLVQIGSDQHAQVLSQMNADDVGAGSSASTVGPCSTQRPVGVARAPDGSFNVLVPGADQPAVCRSLQATDNSAWSAREKPQATRSSAMDELLLFFSTCNALILLYMCWERAVSTC